LRAWAEQCALAATLFLSAPVLNALTTSEPLLVALREGLWSVAGVDIALLVAGTASAWVAARLWRRADVPVALPLPEQT
jgi:hypothetical protein